MQNNLKLTIYNTTLFLLRWKANKNFVSGFIKTVKWHLEKYKAIK